MSNSVPFLAIILAVVTNSHAFSQQCVNPVKPNCDFYSKCMEATCKCGFAADGYALSYGLKYCRRFLNDANLSPQGEKWRDATLRCLQETLVTSLRKIWCL